MKPMKKRLLSLLLTLVTILSLLPTSALAASKTGSGIQITTNQAYWSTRLLANGTPYSYRPPLADGKLVYCMDSGLGYHYATASFLNSFTWTSGSGADADAVLQSAVANSGLSEMDAMTVENVKWMMTYLNDCKDSNVGQLFMGVQTYVWENQSYKGEPGGDGDAGGYANADTYELYLSLIDDLLAKKAAEDAEFLKQIEAYKAQGIEASIVEDESAKWAVFAISSNRKNQSFFNYYGPRKLVTGEPVPDQPEQPTGGTGKITLKKTAAGTLKGLPGARYSIYFNGQIVGSDVTGESGELHIEDAATGLWTFVETAAPSGYCVDPTPKSVYVDVSEGDREYTVAAVNYAMPSMIICKEDAQTSAPVPGTVLSVKSVTGAYVRFEGLSAGRFYLREGDNEGYIPDKQEKTVYVRNGETTEIEWKNTPITGQIQVIKTSADYNSMNGWPAGTPIPDTELEIYNARTNRLVDTIKADKNGLAVSKPLPLGRYKIVESKAGKFYGLDKTPIEVEIEYAGQIVKVSMTNKSLSTNVSIKKTGPSQAVPGQPIRYVFSQIKNGSNVSLDSFYWRDQIPAQITLNKIVTGSYNQQQNYKVVYKTNLSEDYRTLADNLSTSKVYVLDARPAVLGLAANERVTEIMFVFGNVRAGFAQVETPYIYATARSGLANNSSIVNVADVGGLYNGQWIQAVSRWLTTIYAKTTVRLPKTGY